MESFFTNNHKVQHIIKNINLTKTLFVSSIIIGKPHTGKKTLACYLFPHAMLVSGKNKQEVIDALENHDELIIIDFEKILHHQLDFSNKRIIATADYIGNMSAIDELFAFIYTMPSLQERPDDVSFLLHKFIQEAQSVFMLKEQSIDIENIPIDLTQNSKSLKKSIYLYLSKHNISTSDIYDILFKYFYNNYEGNNNYRKHIGIFEKPLIEAGLNKFGSQLRLANALGINRNTLRKKIHDHHIT